MLPRFGRFRPGAIVTSRGGALGWGQTIQKLDDPTQPIEVEQVLGPGLRGEIRRGGVVRAAQSKGGVATVREPDNEVGILPAAKANDLDALTAQGMMGMSDGDESPRRWGWGGSVLGPCRTMTDRAMQALYLLGLDPIAESQADGHSYGFRLERRCADALNQVHLLLGNRHGPQWILEGDIKACFDSASWYSS
jgi:Reverse transcriptase (RNA-dependent DNA polymerase)